MNLKYFVNVLIILCSLHTTSIFAQIPENFYNGTETLTGDELKTALYNIIKGHVEFPYTSSQTDVWDILKNTDKDPHNQDNVILLYTGWSVNGAQEYNNENGWSREHVWAKSHGDFGTEIGPGTDVHALRPCDISVNTARWNFDFAEGGNIYTDPDGVTECKYTSNSWEPRDAVKGDVARMLFYMATRYEGENGEPDLKLVDYVNSSPNYEPLHGKLADLLKWHAEDPVDDWEKNRNNIIYYDYQHNRNPFIDHPEFADKIFGGLVSAKTVDNQTVFKIYPNPAKDFLILELNLDRIQSQNFKVQILDLTGKEQLNFKLNSNFLIMDCSKLAKGCYILQITRNQNVRFSKKVIIEQ